MSRYPDNPHWCQTHDHPNAIYRQDWDEAVAAGHVTPEHIAQRVAGMIQHAYGVHEGDSIRFDKDGFIDVLTAEGLRMANGVVLNVRTGDHDPPHAHIEMPGLDSGRLTINLDTFEIEQNLPDGWSKKGRKVEREALRRAESLLALWDKNRGPNTRPAKTADSVRTDIGKGQVS